jgi:glutathione synthase
MSGKKLAVIMDPIQNIKPHKDSSLAMLLEAQKRGFGIFCAGLANIWLDGAKARGKLTKIKVFDDSQRWFEIVETDECDLGDLDVVLMRKDPPFDMQYICATYVLEQAERQGALIVNRPAGLRDANEKASTVAFPDCIPATLISRSIEQMRKFIAKHERIVVKPLDLMGGRSVFSTDIKDGNHNVIFETVSDYGQKYTVLQQYIPEIAESGDRRILLIDGEPIPFGLARIPAAGDHRGNMDAGARVEVNPLTEREWSICKQVGPTLREKGLVFTGIDVIGGFMTELNVTSPTGIRELTRETGIPIAEKLFDSIEAHFHSNQNKSTASGA